MQSDEIRKRFIEFFKQRGHAEIPSASLVPENDPTTLFTGSGMQPMIPYLLGQEHPLGNKVVDSQKCFRAEDIDEIGDNRHTTFFEMLGNWSFGDYFKDEQLEWVSSFLFDEIGINPEKLFVTVFSGEEKFNLPKDIESAKLWQEIFKKCNIEAKIIELGSEEEASKVGMQDGRIFYYNAKKNWWSRAGVPEKMPVGEPGGPDSEMFYEFSNITHDSKYGEHCHPNCDCGRYLEIGNNVFMAYKKVDEGRFEELPKKNVDFGGGLERITSAVNDDLDIFHIDSFVGIIERLEQLSNKKYGDPVYTKSFRVIADHVRASDALIVDGVLPSNTEQGYVLRRLMRRAIVHSDKLGIPNNSLFENQIGKDEESKFRKTLDRGIKEFEAGQRDPFLLFTSYGFPYELTKELVLERGELIDENEFQEKMKKHQYLSRAGAQQKFAGGLADHKDETVRLHTAHHLLLASLQKVLGPDVHQRGSNITSERLRIDFSFPRKMTADEIKQIEDLVNQKISEKLPVIRLDMPRSDAEKLGAEMEFGVKYGDVVSVYCVKEKDGSYFSKEFCGGPHVSNTGELGHIKITKEEASSAGVRRIKAVLTNNN